MSVTGGAIPSCNWRKSFGRCANIFIASRASAPYDSSQSAGHSHASCTHGLADGHGSSGSISTRDGNPKSDHEPICPSRFRINALLSSSVTIRYYTKSHLSASLPLRQSENCFQRTSDLRRPQSDAPTLMRWQTLCKKQIHKASYPDAWLRLRCSFSRRLFSSR